jgi:hypothetical protein
MHRLLLCCGLAAAAANEYMVVSMLHLSTALAAGRTFAESVVSFSSYQRTGS